MWLVALSLGATFKVLVWWPHWRKAGLAKSVAFLAGWIGMDPTPFLEQPLEENREQIAWRGPASQILLGATMFWLLARQVGGAHTPLTGWIGLVGFALMFHFGFLNLLAAAWRAVGIGVQPIMQAPIRSVSVGEFWGRRWNRAFRDLAHRWVFKPLLPRVGGLGASAACYLASGLTHELVTSVPARGGYGLPTGYFLIQALGTVAEHSRLGRQWGLGRGVRGWIFSAVVTAGPAYWLFHPPFVERVFLPFMQFLGAI
jgi:alginate O-acetyltransferase complex protein AlgI